MSHEHVTPFKKHRGNFGNFFSTKSMFNPWGRRRPARDSNVSLTMIRSRRNRRKRRNLRSQGRGRLAREKLGTWASRPRKTWGRGRLAREKHGDVGVSPATKMHTHQRNMPHGIAGRMPTSLRTAREIFNFQFSIFLTPSRSRLPSGTSLRR